MAPVKDGNVVDFVSALWASLIERRYNTLQLFVYAAVASVMASMIGRFLLSLGL